MTEYTAFAFPNSDLGSFLLAFYPNWSSGFEDDEAVDMADLGWSANGTREGYRSMGTFASLREARIAIEVIGRVLSTPNGGDDPSAFLKAHGFTCPPVVGFSVPGMPYWEKEIDGRWFAYFVHDELNGIDLRVSDRQAEVYKQVVLASIHLPEDLQRKGAHPCPAIDEALLAILAARMEAGDPFVPVR